MEEKAGVAGVERGAGKIRGVVASEYSHTLKPQHGKGKTTEVSRRLKGICEGRGN